MSKPTQRFADSILIYLFQPKTKQQKNPPFMFRTSRTTRWNVMNVQCDASKSTMQKKTLRKHKQKSPCWEFLHFAWWSSAFLSFHPGSRQISVMCAERRRELHVVPLVGSSRVLQDWQVYSPLNMRGLSLLAAPEPPAGFVLTQANFLKPEKQALFFLLRNMMDTWRIHGVWDLNHFHAVFKILEVAQTSCNCDTCCS